MDKETNANEHHRPRHRSGKRLYRFLDVLKQVCLDIASEPNLNAMLKNLTGLVAKTLDAEICSLFLCDETDPEWLVLRTAYGYPHELIGQRTHRLGEGITGDIVKTKTHFRADSPDEVKRHPKHKGHLDEKMGSSCRTFLGYPICYRTEAAIGTLKVENKRATKTGAARTFTHGDEIVLETICGVLAVKFKSEELMRDIWKANHIADFFHTFRSPLFTVRGTCEQLIRLLEQGREVSDYENRVRNALVEASRFEQLVNNSAFWTQKTSVLKSEALNLRDVAGPIVKRYTEAAIISRAELIFGENMHCPESGEANEAVRTIHTNKRTFELILCNLLDNAINYGRGKVSCSLSWSEDRYKVVVIDNGPGMTDIELNSATQPHYRGPASNGKDGLGLGLSVCERALYLLGGKMTFTNIQPPTGLQVEVTCPAARPTI